MTLPLFIHRNNYILMALLCGLAFFFGYEVPNHFHLYPPQQLRLTEFDRWVPFMPWSVLVYTSEYLLFATAYFAIDHDTNRNRYMWAYFGVLAVGAVFFVFFPTTYPRADFPLPTNMNPVIFAIFDALRRFDDPSNCFPSMHVTCCYITAFAFLPKEESRKKFWFYFVWATLVAASTLPTKQHYLADVMGGLVLSISGYWVFFKVVRYVPLSEYGERFRSTFSRAES